MNSSGRNAGPTSGNVDQHLEAVGRGESAGTVNFVNATETRYILARKYDRETADAFLDWLWTIGVAAVDAETVWERAAEYVVDINPALGDAYAVATAESVGGTVLVGGDEGFDDVSDVSLERFRDHGV